MAGGRHSNPGGESRAAHPLAVRPAWNTGRVEGWEPAIQRQPGAFGGAPASSMRGRIPRTRLLQTRRGAARDEPPRASAGSLGHWAAPQEQLINTEIPVPRGIVYMSEIF